MPQQEVFMDETVNNNHVRVLKSYDRAFAREVFECMDEVALNFLSSTLDDELPGPQGPEFADSLWERVEDSAREDWNSVSYFVVEETRDGRPSPVFVSSDWPSASAFANRLLRPGATGEESAEVS